MKKAADSMKGIGTRTPSFLPIPDRGSHNDFIGRLSALAQDGAMEIYAWF